MFARGVTLLEMMVVLLIAGILAALALPAYRQHLVRVNRSQATTLLYEIASAQERYFLRHGNYSGNLGSGAPLGLGLAAVNTSSRYSFSVALAGDGQTYIASATPRREGGQHTDVECLVFSIDQRGRRAVSGTRDTAFCWR
jgi:type IV pilus assembly protein PilE